MPVALLDRLAEIVGPAQVLTGPDCARWAVDWTGKYAAQPLAVVRPASTAEVSGILRLAHEAATPVVPVSGHTGLTGGGAAGGALVLSLDRMSAITEINAAARTATVEAGVILSRLHDAAAAQDLVFPVTFGARGSAMIGGILGTNAGGSNVVRHGNARDLCLGLEAVLADGRIVNLMSALHKDNSGYNLRHLLIGSEGTLAVITRAVLKLAARPRAYATATVAVRSLPDALALLNRLRDATNGAVEAFELMPRSYIAGHLQVVKGARPPFAEPHDFTLLIEVAASSDRDATPRPDGSIPIVGLLEAELAALMERGPVLDAVIARTEAQRRQMWERREAAAEIAFARAPIIDTDIAVALDKVEAFLDGAAAGLARLDPKGEPFYVSHLGDGNIHYNIYPSRDDPALGDALVEMIEGVAVGLGGSFSAEHGVGLSKLNTMRRRKDPVALEMMRAIKAALDPKGILNPGKVVPRA